jgi:uncharacterized protein (TIGR00369 family)
MFKVKNPDYQAQVRAYFQQSPFMQDIGAYLIGLGPGWCECGLDIAPRHMQHSGVVHAGVQTTLADNACGAAAGTLIGADDMILSIEFKVNLLRPGVGEKLFCRAEVLKPGQSFSVIEAEVFALQGEERKLTLKMLATMVSLPQNRA